MDKVNFKNSKVVPILVISAALLIGAFYSGLVRATVSPATERSVAAQNQLGHGYNVANVIKRHPRPVGHGRRRF